MNLYGSNQAQLQTVSAKRLRLLRTVSIVESDEQDRSSAFSEESRSPPRCYDCNFCKREFKSAKALGGHMNVHRRDRALLRLSSNSNSNSTSSLFPPDNAPLILTSKHDNSLLSNGVDYLLQQPHSALPTSPHNGSTTSSPFFQFFDSSSSNLGLQGQSPCSEQTGLNRFGNDAVYCNPFECSIEDPSPSVSFICSRDVANLEVKMEWRGVGGNNVPNNVGLDLELRLGHTS